MFYYPSYRQMPTLMAFAQIKASKFAPNLNGYVIFTEVPQGTEVYVEVAGLPQYKRAIDGKSPIGPHGFHIHEKGNCDITDSNDPFHATGGHWNPDNEPHGNHAGDFPVLFSNDGYTRMSFFTNRFKPKDVIGKSIIIHENPDDYRTQPSGNSGQKIGCGIIQAYA